MEARPDVIPAGKYTFPSTSKATVTRCFLPVNQIELSPYLTMDALTSFCKSRSIVVEAYSPLTKGTKLNDPKLVAIAKKWDSKLNFCIILCGLACTPDMARALLSCSFAGVCSKGMSASPSLWRRRESKRMVRCSTLRYLQVIWLSWWVMVLLISAVSICVEFCSRHQNTWNEGLLTGWDVVNTEWIPWTASPTDYSTPVTATITKLKVRT